MPKTNSSKLTKRLIDAIKIPDEGKEVIIWDSEVKGFFIRVLSSGTKTYNLKYRMPGGRGAKQGQIKLGRHGELTVEQARQAALDHKEKVRKNVDPRIKMSDNSSITLSALLDGYIKEVEKRGVGRTTEQYTRIADLHIRPLLGNRMADTITSSDVAHLHQKMHEIQHQANRMLSLLSATFTWAKKSKVIECDNPCVSIKKYDEEPKERFLSDVEIARLEKTLDHAAAKGLKFTDKKTKKRKTYHFSLYVIAAIRALLHTGARLNEILCLEWSQIDTQQKLLRLPDSKTGKKDITISKTALDILNGIEKVKNNKYVFVGQISGTHLVNIQKSWGIIREHAGIAGTRIHDLRHTLASKAINAGVPLQIVGSMLGHKCATTTARYAHIADDALKSGIALTEQAMNKAVTHKVSNA